MAQGFEVSRFWCSGWALTIVTEGLVVETKASSPFQFHPNAVRSLAVAEGPNG